MMQWDIWIKWFKAHEILIGWMGFFSLVMFLGTLIAIPMIIVALPEDFLSGEEEKIGRQMLNAWYLPYLVLKNIVGAILIVAGVAMLVLPGQGLLTILIGLGLVTFPGKRLLIHRILGNKQIVHMMNTLRGKFGKRPIRFPGDPSQGVRCSKGSHLSH
jgi:hypothetical protein